MAKIIEKAMQAEISKWLLVAMMAGGGIILGITGWRLLNPNTLQLNSAEASVIIAVVGAGGLVYTIYEKLNK